MISPDHLEVRSVELQMGQTFPDVKALHFLHASSLGNRSPFYTSSLLDVFFDPFQSSKILLPTGYPNLADRLPPR